VKAIDPVTASKDTPNEPLVSSPDVSPARLEALVAIAVAKEALSVVSADV
jgi:hypothetical protein